MATLGTFETYERVFANARCWPLFVVCPVELNGWSRLNPAFETRHLKVCLLEADIRSSMVKGGCRPCHLFSCPRSSILGITLIAPPQSDIQSNGPITDPSDPRMRHPYSGCCSRHSVLADPVVPENGQRAGRLFVPTG
jgi:hypothetical protein